MMFCLLQGGHFLVGCSLGALTDGLLGMQTPVYIYPIDWASTMDGEVSLGDILHIADSCQKGDSLPVALTSSIDLQPFYRMIDMAILNKNHSTIKDALEIITQLSPMIETIDEYYSEGDEEISSLISLIKQLDVEQIKSTLTRLVNLTSTKSIKDLFLDFDHPSLDCDAAGGAVLQVADRLVQASVGFTSLMIILTILIIILLILLLLSLLV